jgi:hypothetical protein
MEADAPLVERRILMFGRGVADEHAGARADAIEDLAGHVVLDRHAEGFVQQLVSRTGATRRRRER